MLAGFAKLGVSQQELSRESKAQSHPALPVTCPGLGLEPLLGSAEWRWHKHGVSSRSSAPAPALRKHKRGEVSSAEPCTACAASLLLRAAGLAAALPSCQLGQPRCHQSQPARSTAGALPCCPTHSQLIPLAFLLGSNLQLSYVSNLRNLDQTTELRVEQGKCGVKRGQQMPSRAVGWGYLDPGAHSTSVPGVSWSSLSRLCQKYPQQTPEVHGY